MSPASVAVYLKMADVFFALAVLVAVIMLANRFDPATCPHANAKTEALFERCLKQHPQTADVVLWAPSPIDRCLNVACVLTSTTTP
jgi:hypothetical protein